MNQKTSYKKVNLYLVDNYLIIIYMKEPKQLLMRAKEIASQARVGIISYDEAKELTSPLLEQYNEHARKIARNYGKKWYDLKFTKLLRLY